MSWGGRELTKLIPVYGSAVSAAYTGAVTFALGQTLNVYFSRIQQGSVPSKEVFAEIYQQELLRGREVIQDYLSGLRK